MTFKKGDIVKYVGGRHGDRMNNPLWGGEFGRMTGVIINPKYENNYIQVKWRNDEINCYKKEDLRIIGKNEISAIEKLKQKLNL